MGIDNSFQIISAVYAFVLGAALGVVFDIFRIMRLFGLKHRVLVFFQDILFFVISTIALFSYYMQVTDGKFRIYPFFCVIIGFYIYFITIGKLVIMIMKKIVDTAVFIVKWIYKKALIPIFKALKKVFMMLFAPIGRFFKKIGQNILKIFKNLLQKSSKMLYNRLKISKNKKEMKTYAEKDGTSQGKRFFC